MLFEKPIQLNIVLHISNQDNIVDYKRQNCYLLSIRIFYKITNILFESADFHGLSTKDLAPLSLLIIWRIIKIDI